MIFVNDGAGGYWWMEHATWNGLVAGDLVFPAFLWIMGVCIPLSVKSAFAKGVPRWKIVMHIVRVSKIYVIFRFLYSFYVERTLLCTSSYQLKVVHCWKQALDYVINRNSFPK